MTEETQPEKPYPQLFKNHAMYQELQPSVRVAVDRGIQDKLRSIDCNRIFTPVEKEQERKWFLKEGALLLLENMWKGQQTGLFAGKHIMTEGPAKKNDNGHER